MVEKRLKNLRQGQRSLSKKYKTQHKTGRLSENERDAYLHARLPATSSVCKKVLSHIHEKNKIQRILDLGCGPGSATYAALEVFEGIKQVHLVDRDKGYTYDFSVPHTFSNVGLEQFEVCNEYDLAIASYVFNECPHELLVTLLPQVWQKITSYFIIIEPGTPFGYQSFLKSRDILINCGASLVAPCPHEKTCPLSENDWCHFKERLIRSPVHQQVKSGARSFEDESYIYGVFAKQPPQERANRILKKPRKGSGHISFDLCTPHGVEKKIISRKSKESFLKAKKLSWGDVLKRDNANKKNELHE
ncbi:small ribosomal subunit Rsm22 family protein [Alphaproteobacteria bacterium]|nr:small ribosomal subunit Rsm22 family protein [Alphaproteobacteria bacterium]